MRKRITKPKKIDLDLLYPVASASPNEIELEQDDELYDEYNPDGEYIKQEHKKLVPDGEQAFFSAINQGEDW